MAPYDVRQGHFVGAGVNMVTRSGAQPAPRLGLLLVARQRPRRHRGQGARLQSRHVRLPPLRGLALGPDPQGQALLLRQLRERQVHAARDDLPREQGRRDGGGQRRRACSASDLDALSTYLKTNFGYDTGPYQDYPFETPAKRYLGKLDYNLNTRNKVSVRYLQLDSLDPGPGLELELARRRQPPHAAPRPSTSRTRTTRSSRTSSRASREWNSIISSNMANSLIVGYTKNDESRPQSGELFPMVDIREAGTVYTTFGYEPFTPANQLRYHSFQAQDSFTWSKSRHTFTFGGDASSATTPTTCSSRAPRASTSTTRSPTSTPTPTTTSPTRTAPRRR